MEPEIVISGVSGRFPESDSVTEFAENLFNKVDLMREDDRRWEPGVYGLPRKLGMLKDISKFDNHFFGVDNEQANLMNPQARMLLELTYESIVDAGYDPDELRGRNIGVYIGKCSYDRDEFFIIDKRRGSGYGLSGCDRAMYANIVSYTFDFKGPSFLLDTACSSGSMALYQAVQAMRRGECEAAIVGGANLCLKPETALLFYKLNMLSDDGMCKSFDDSGNGYGRSEAVATLFLQRADAARRKYATVVHVKTNTDGFKEQGITFPSAGMQKSLISEVYSECQLDPLKISYVEAHGTGTAAGDPIEMSSISEVFCSGREESLLVGTVKSNMGHSESTSGICGIDKVHIHMENDLIPQNLHFKTSNPEIKALIDGKLSIVTDPVPWAFGYAASNCIGCGRVNVHGVLESNPVTLKTKEDKERICGIVKIIIAMETGSIPPNLHFKTPNPQIKALIDGKVSIVTEPTPWAGGYAAFSSFGFGGVNVHGVLESNSVIFETKEDKDDTIPQLVFYSGRSKDSVQTLFDYLDANRVSREFCALLHKSVYTPPELKPFRGYKVLSGDEEVSDIQQPSAEKRPLWYIFSGMGTQWPAMAKQLMDMNIFANSIRRSAEVLKPYRFDLVNVVTNGIKVTSNSRSIIPAFVSIAAVQVALVDLLKEIGFEPDGYVGHSVGEFGCAYADGCLTAEQMVLAAYWIGKAVEESELQEGAMAAIGITWSQAHKCCPKDIYPSCHNAEDAVTVSGPKDNVKVFIDALKAENVFAREVDSCGIAFHSQYVFPVADKLQTALERVITNPKPRTNRWISSSYPEDKWNDPESKISGASYFVHNLVSPVLFHEALHYIPKNAVVVEIAPHHLLQAILKRVIGPDAVNIGLMKRNVDNTVHLLSSIGKLYNAGFNPDIEKLYPPVIFPVPKGTPMIAPFIKWNHSKSWSVPKWDKNARQSEMIVEVNARPPESPDHYILEHCIDGRILYPSTGYIVLVWKTFAETRSKEMTACPVIFENVKIHRETRLSEAASTKFVVDIASVSGEFEISEGRAPVCTGRVSTPVDSGKKCVFKNLKPDLNTFSLHLNDIYKELKLRGYEYGPTFQGLISSDISGHEGLLKWTGNWVVFLDTMLQFTILGRNKRALYLHTQIQKLTIDPLVHAKIAEEVLKEYEGIPIKHDKLTGQCFAGGVYLKKLKANFSPRQPVKQVPVLEEYNFVPYNEPCTLSRSQRELYECYVHVCSSISKMILKLSGKDSDQISHVVNQFKEADDAIIENYLKSYTDNHVLLKSLCGIMNAATSKDLTTHVKNYVNTYLNEKENDILFQTLTEEVPLRTVIDVALENISSRKLKIAEVTEGSSPLSSKLFEYIQTVGALNINYVIAHTNTDVLDRDCLPPNAEVKSWNYKSPFDLKDVDIFVLKYLSCSKMDFKRILEDASACVKSNGFIVVLQRTKLVPPEKFLSVVAETLIPTINENDLEQFFTESNLTVICKKSDSLASTLYLIRKSIASSYKDSVVHISVDKYDQWVDQLKEKMPKSRESSESQRIWLVSEGSNHSGIVGLTNCLLQEPGGSSIRCVFTGKEITDVPEFGFSSPFYQDLFKKDLVMNIFKRGSWGSYRHVLYNDLSKVETKHAYLNVLATGDLSSLVWVDSPMKYFKPSERAVLCQVYYASLNFSDIMLASGKQPLDAIAGDLDLQHCIIGFEFSGRTLNGQRVMGVLSHKAMATTVAADPDFLWNVPDKWTLEEAATIPWAYVTAYYALVDRGNLKKGERVLIHSGGVGVGQAAISIALSYGCEVFTSVGSAEKREFLKKRFPQLQEKNFCNSRDISFEEYILIATNGKGVDVVLNSLADEKLMASLNCLAVHGRFLQIGMYDLSNNTPLGMALFLKNVSFHGIIVDSLFDGKATKMKKKLVELVNKGISDGTVRPLNTILFSYDQAEQAVRYMASGRHVGKVVLKIKEEESQKKVVPTSVSLSAIPKTTCDPKKSYIIIGGLGRFGLELCQWLVDCGAKNIILTSRSGVKNGYQQLCIYRWKQESVNIVVSTLNSTKKDEARQIIEIAAKHGTVGGIFNLALALKGALMENQTVQNYIDVCDCNVQSTKNLDSLSRELCPELDWFVCFSSFSSGRRNAGQSNYGYANSVMERVCEDRVREGLSGLAIQWGAIGDVGEIKNTAGSELVVCRSVPQKIISCLSVLDKFLQKKNPVVSSFVPYQPQ